MAVDSNISITLSIGILLRLAQPIWLTGQHGTTCFKLWNRESSWLWYSRTRVVRHTHSGNPCRSKMAPFGANWRDIPPQIDWGLNYIAQRYG